MSSRAPKFLPPAALQAEVERTDKLRSSCQTALQKAQEVCDSAQNKLTAALSRLEATKLLLETLTEDKAAVQLDADILEHLVKTLTASHERKEADIERLADELKRGEEELTAGEKDVDKCRGVEELAKSSLAETEGKLKKAEQEYEKTYARANPAPEPKSESAIEKDKKDREKQKERDSRSDLRKKKRSPSPRRDAKSRRTSRRSPSPLRSPKRSRRQSRSRSRDRRRRRSRSRSKSADRKRRKSPAPLRGSAKKTGEKSSTKKTGNDETKPDKAEQAKNADITKKRPEEKAGPAVADSALSEADHAEDRNGVSTPHADSQVDKASEDTPVKAPPATAAAAGGAAEALPNGDAGGTAKGEVAEAAAVKDVREEKVNGHVSNDKAAASGSDGDSDASSSRHSRSPSVGTPKRSRRSVSSSGSPAARRARGRRSLSDDPPRRRPGSPRRRATGSPRRRGRSDTPVRRRRSVSRRRSLSRSRSRIRVRSPPRLEKFDASTMDLFKTSLRKCLEHHLVPFNISLINDIMRKEDRSWNIRRLNTTFLTFMKKLEDEGYVDLATRGSTTMVAGSARYKDIIEATTERIRQARLERRSRSRSRLRSPPSGRRRSRSPLRSRRSASRGRMRSPVRRRRSPSPRRRRSGSPGRGGERWALGGGGERWEMT